MDISPKIEISDILKNFKHVPSEMFKRMSLFVLWLISKRKVHGYELIKWLQSEGIPASASRLYPLLNQMLAEDLISQKEEKDGRRIKKIYRLTSKGKNKLKNGKNLFSGLFGEFLKEMIR
ncbi:MAG TPA: helix-turn-helix transcriptional regulator [Candidatus Bilamarchaeaceae archaeon]|nr:helix-turn-helix transcriptional regulator [Candidatus Bilamarchaeaceae archaeon]